jgi:hypothetical protein
MNDNWQRMSPFVRFPEYNLGSMAQPSPSRELIPVEQIMGGKKNPFMENVSPAIAPQRLDYGKEQPSSDQGKKILGMPKDQFVALMGSIAYALAPNSPGGRMGAGLINMANMMRQERLERGKEEKETAKEAEDKRRWEAQEKRLGQKKYAGDVAQFVDIYGRPPESAEELGKFKTQITPEKKETGKAPTIKTFRVGERDVPHSYNLETKKWEPIPGMPGKKVIEKGKMTEAQARKDLFELAKYKQKLKTTGGLDDVIYYMMQSSSPEQAKAIAEADKTELESKLNERERWLRTFIPRKTGAPASVDIETRNALEAIKQGIPADKVREMYKIRTGKEATF